MVLLIKSYGFFIEVRQIYKYLLLSEGIKRILLSSELRPHLEKFVILL